MDIVKMLIEKTDILIKLNDVPVIVKLPLLYLAVSMLIEPSPSKIPKIKYFIKLSDNLGKLIS